MWHAPCTCNVSDDLISKFCKCFKMSKSCATCSSDDNDNWQINYRHCRNFSWKEWSNHIFIMSTKRHRLTRLPNKYRLSTRCLMTREQEICLYFNKKQINKWIFRVFFSCLSGRYINDEYQVEVSYKFSPLLQLLQ